MDFFDCDDLSPLGPNAPIFTDFERQLQEAMKRYLHLEIDHWPADQPRLKAAFGSEGVELSMAQAKRAKLVRHHGRYPDVLYRVHHDNPAREDRLLSDFLEKEEAAKERAKARKKAATGGT